MPGIEGDLYRNSLNNLGEIARGIVRREQRELRSACRSNFDSFSVEHDTRIRIDPDIDHVAGSDIGKLVKGDVWIQANFKETTGRLISVGLSDLRGALHLGVDEAS